MENCNKKHTRLYKILFYGGIENHEYDKISSDIMQKNSEMLFESVLTSVFIFIFLIVSSFIQNIVAENKYIYISMLTICIVIACLVKIIRKINLKLILWLWYLFALAYYAFAIYIGALSHREYTATTICVLLITIPLLIIDRPIRIILFQIILTILFCVIAYQMKPYNIASVDIVNTLSFFVLSVFVNVNISRVKARDLINAKYVEEASETDELTHLLNKTAAQKKITEFLNKEDVHGAVIIFDVDNFKLWNDTYGHLYGDFVLKSVGLVVSNLFTNNEILCRFGGDEFVVFFRQQLSEEELILKGNKLISSLEGFLPFKHAENHIQISIGAAVVNENGTTYEDVLSKADKALYKAKDNGRNRVCVYSAEFE